MNPNLLTYTILDGIALLIVALLGLLIAYRQMTTARTKLQLDLYDRRLPTYVATVTFIRQIVLTGALNNKDLDSFQGSTSEARFLFDDELKDYLDRIESKAISATRHERLLERKAQLSESDKEEYLSLKGAAELLAPELSAVEDMFIPYLRLEDRSARLRASRWSGLFHGAGSD